MNKTIVTSNGRFAVSFKSKGKEFVNEPINLDGPANSLQVRIERDAIKYRKYKDQLDQIPVNEILTFQLEVIVAYNLITNETCYFEDSKVFKFESGNPYKDLGELTCDKKYRKRIIISTDNNDSLLLPGDLNLKFRAIHDYLHYLYQQPFDFAGEYNVYKAQRLFHSSKIGRKILYSEIVLQAAYCTYYGKFSDKQKVIVY